MVNSAQYIIEYKARSKILFEKMSFKNLKNNDQVIQMMNIYGDSWFSFSGPIIKDCTSAFIEAAELGYFKCFVSLFNVYKHVFEDFDILYNMRDKEMTDGHFNIIKFILQNKPKDDRIYDLLSCICYDNDYASIEFIKFLLDEEIKDVLNSQMDEKNRYINRLFRFVEKYKNKLFNFKKPGIGEYIYAAEIGDFENFVILFNKYRYVFKNFNILHIVCEQKLTDGHINIIKFVLQHKSTDLSSVLLTLCKFNNNPPLDIVKLLVEKGADVGKYNSNSCLALAIKNANFELAAFFIEVVKTKGLDYYYCIFDIMDLFSNLNIIRSDIVKLFNLLIVLPGFDESFYDTEVRRIYNDQWSDEKIDHEFTPIELMFYWRKKAWYSDIILHHDLMEVDERISKYFKWRAHHNTLISDFRSSMQKYIKIKNEHENTLVYLTIMKIMKPGAILEFHNNWKKFKFYPAAIQLAALNSTSLTSLTLER